MTKAIVVSWVLAAVSIAGVGWAPPALAVPPSRSRTQERPAGSSTPTLTPSQKAAVGMWRLLGSGHTRPIFGTWLAIHPGKSSNEVEVRWDGGIGCPSALGTIEKDRIRVRIWDVPTKIIVKNGSTAVVRFEMKDRAGIVWHLKKTSDSPSFVCE